MKIVIINGSPRKKGATAGILEQVSESLSSDQHQVEFIHLADAGLKTCIGCSLCFKNGHCCLADRGDEISAKLLAADGVVIGTPTYASNVSGLLKNFIDRSHFVMEQLLTKKKVMMLVTYENAGANTAMKILNDLAVYSGGSVGAKLAVKNDSQKTARKINRAVSHYKASLTDNRKHLREYLTHAVVFHIGIKPFIIKKSTQYQGVLDKWKALKISF